MADDDKQVDIEVALRDTASQTLRSISREIDTISRKLTETGRRGSEAFQRIRDKGNEAGGGSGKASEGVDKFTKSLSNLTKVLSGPVGLAGAFLALSKSLGNFAQHRVELSLLTTDLGLTLAKIGEVQQILSRKGKSEEEAKAFITGIAGQLQDLRTRDVYSDLWRRISIYDDPELGASLLKSVKSGNIDQAFDGIIGHVQGLLAQGEEGRLRAQYFVNEVLSQNLSMFTDWEEARKNLVKTYKVSAEESAKMVREQAILTATIESLANRVADSFVTAINRISDALKNAATAPGGVIPGTMGAPTPGTGTGTSTTPGTPGTGNAPTPGTGTSSPAPVEPRPQINVPRMPGRGSLESPITTGSNQLPSNMQLASAPIPKAFAAAFKDVEESEKETNRTLISVRDILDELTKDPIGSESGGGGRRSLQASLGGSPTSRSGSTGGGPTGGRTGGGGVTGGSMGQMSGTVRGYPVDAYGGLTGTKIVDPMTATHLGGGLGGSSRAFGKGGHQGIDIMGPENSPVHAPMDGRVTKTGTDGYGNQTITIDHGNGTSSVFLHINGVGGFKRGDKVTQGQVIGRSGFANAPHVHWELWKGPPHRKGSASINPRAVMGWDKDNLPVGGQARTGRGPTSPALAPIPQPPPGQPGGWPRTVTPPTAPPVSVRPAPQGPGARPGITLRGGKVLAATPAAGEGGWRTGLASWFDDASTATGMPRTVPGIALPDPATKGQWFMVRDNRTGKEVLTQQTDVGPMGWTKKSIDINRPLARQFGYEPGSKRNDFPTGNKKGFSWRPALDREIAGRGRQSSRRDGNVKASVDFGAMQRVKEAGEIFLPVKTASFSQGSTVHRNAALSGSPDYTRWTA